MHKTRFAAIVAAIVAVSAIASGSAVATQLMAGGKNVSGTTTASASKVDKSTVLSSSGLTVECPGIDVEKTVHPPEEDGTVRELLKILFLLCSVSSPTTCTVPTTLLFGPSQGEPTLDGSLAIQAILAPQTGKVFTTISVSGAECAAAGSKPTTGDFSVLMPKGQDETTDQATEFKQGSTGLLKLGSESASLSGTILELLASHEAWSFL